MNYLFVGDIHTHRYMLEDIMALDKNYNFDNIVFLGDYVDDWGSTGEDSINTLKNVLALKAKNSDKYTLLLGNHELSYLGYPCSGHDYRYERAIKDLLYENLSLFDVFKFVYTENTRYICSHAGFTDAFVSYIADYYDKMNNLKVDLEQKVDWLNISLKNGIVNPALSFCSHYRGGNDKFSSCLWCDRQELIESDTNLFQYQIVGHSPVKEIHSIGHKWFIDSHSTYRDGTQYGDNSYLLFLKDKFIIK